MFERLKAALTPWLLWFSAFSLPARFLIGATVSAIGSAGAVGVITKLGAYWFVLYYGVRTPADGIPYVAETAAIISVLILTSGSICYLIVYVCMLLIGQFLQFIGVLAPNGVFLLTSKRSSLRLFIILFALQAPAMLLMPWAPFAMVLWFQAAAAIVTLAITAFIQAGGGPSALAACVLTVASFFLLWLPPTYGWFLRTIGHGGGRYCTVHLRGELSPQTINGYLIVRTGTALLMFDGKEETIEIPLDEVVRIHQSTMVYWCLPGNTTPTAADSKRIPSVFYVIAVVVIVFGVAPIYKGFRNWREFRGLTKSGR